MSNTATLASPRNKAAGSSGLLGDLFRATPLYLFATSLLAALRQSAKR